MMQNNEQNYCFSCKRIFIVAFNCDIRQSKEKLLIYGWTKLIITKSALIKMFKQTDKAYAHDKRNKEGKSHFILQTKHTILNVDVNESANKFCNYITDYGLESEIIFQGDDDSFEIFKSKVKSFDRNQYLNIDLQSYVDFSDKAGQEFLAIIREKFLFEF